MEVVDVVALCSVAGSTVLLATGRSRLAGAGSEPQPKSEPGSDSKPGSVSRPNRRDVEPWAALVVVTAALVLSQLLVVLHVEGAHGGDASYVSRWLGPQWFDLPDWDALHRLAQVWPQPDLLAPSVLRVPALLELPFVLLAYLTVASFVAPEVSHRLRQRSLLWAASAAFTVTFCVIEWELRNPWTAGDLLLRVGSGVLTPWCLDRVLSTRGGSTTQSAGRLVLGLTSAAALGGLVLVLYDTVLLYNLGRLGDRLPTAYALGVVLVVSRVAARGFERRTLPADMGAGTAWLVRLARAGVVAFFVPCLALRYEVTFGSAPLALVGGLVVVVTASALSQPTREAVAHAAPGGVAAVLAGLATKRLARGVGGYYEVTLLIAGTVAVGALIVVSVLVDRTLKRSTERSPAGGSATG